MDCMNASANVKMENWNAKPNKKRIVLYTALVYTGTHKWNRQAENVQINSMLHIFYISNCHLTLIALDWVKKLLSILCIKYEEKSFFVIYPPYQHISELMFGDIKHVFIVEDIQECLEYMSHLFSVIIR